MADDPAQLIDDARAAAARCDWPRAGARYEQARAAGADLAADDLFALGDATWWQGEVDASIAAYDAAHRAHLQDGDGPRAAHAALEVGVNLLLRGDTAEGLGWLGRVQRILADEPEGCVHGYLACLLEVDARLGGIAPGGGGAADEVITSARRIGALGRRHDDPSLQAVAIMGEGRALVKAGAVEEGMALLDEAMVAVRTGDLDPKWAGNVYCHLMSAAHEVADIRRAIAWTAATADWLATLPAAVLFTGICRVHRSQVHQLTGAWERAEHEAVRVCSDLQDIQPASAAEGHYQVGEIRRLRGELGRAEAAYARAHELGRDPQPGLALLRLAQGRVAAAHASIRAARLAHVADPLLTARLCAAHVDIAVAAGDLDAAGAAADELAGVVSRFGTLGLRLAALHADGVLALARGRPGDALAPLRTACAGWRDAGCAYDAARAQALLAQAYAEVGDHDAADRERDAAAATFARLGAADVAPAGPANAADAPGGLTDREVEVLALVAAGRTNREVARDLVISDRTVGRHLSNIFTKIGAASRTEAAAYAFRHDLVDPDPR